MPQPYTLNFGPWAPDLQNVGVQMPYQFTATPLPVADCLNVYWQDGAYRCLPAPSAIGPTLGIPILNAVNWYDEPSGEEQVFAGTANGLFVLLDGAWYPLPVESNSSAVAIGSIITVSLGTPLYINYAVAPTSQSASGVATSYTFGTETIAAPNASAYTWSFSSETAGTTWAVSSGQSTAAAVPQVSGVGSGVTATADFNCAITIYGNTYNTTATLSYMNAFTPVLDLYSNQSSMVETIPSGASQVVIEIWGGGGQGGAQYNIPTQVNNGGGGGGAGGYSKKTYSISSSNWGQTMDVSATTAATDVVVSSGTFSITTLTAHQGAIGGAAGPTDPGTGGAGGTASGGSTNTSGGDGSDGDDNDNGGDGGTPVSGTNAGPYGAGGGGLPNGTGTQQPGGAAFYYT